MSQAPLGIDHPLVTVRDHPATLENYRRMGFSPSPVSYHPWGTVTSLLMFADNFIEIIGVDDATKFGPKNPENGALGDFCFGRFLGDFLDREEGISLVALHSGDARADAAAVVARGLQNRGFIDFRRKMTLPDGTPDEAVVSLALLIDAALPEASHFICHQHRPELIWVPEWQQHDNGARGITSITYLAESPQALAPRLAGLYGEAALQHGADLLRVDTGCGEFRVVDAAGAARLFPGAAVPPFDTSRPHGIAVSVAIRSLDEQAARLRDAGIEFARAAAGEAGDSLLVGAGDSGNIILEFTE